MLTMFSYCRTCWSQEGRNMIQDIVELIRLRSTVQLQRSGPMLPLYLLLGELQELQLGTILSTFWVRHRSI